MKRQPECLPIRSLKYLSLISCCCAAAGAVGWAAEEDDARPFSLLTVGVLSAPVPKVTEKTSAPNGITTTYDWNRSQDTAARLSLCDLRGTVKNLAGYAWGGELEYGQSNITPKNFTVSSRTYANQSTSKLSYRTLGANLHFGYVYGIPVERDLKGFLALTGYVGGGLAQADADLKILDSYTKKRGTGYMYQYGARLGAYLTETRLTLGVIADVGQSHGQVKASTAGYSSTLTLDRFGFGVGVVAGYLF